MDHYLYQFHGAFIHFRIDRDRLYYETYLRTEFIVVSFKTMLCYRYSMSGIAFDVIFCQVEFVLCILLLLFVFIVNKSWCSFKHLFYSIQSVVLVFVIHARLMLIMLLL